jgi:2-methylisocitrate lyase-like PEP mutase family enzyme
MAVPVHEKRRAFAKLHEAGCFVMPNPWDIGSAKLLADSGFLALATTSAGMAWTLGRPDGQVSLDEVLLHLSALAHATDLPLNADFENGFADAPEAAAANAALALDTGIAGLSIEDYAGPEAGLYDFSLAVERIAAVRETIDRAAPGAVFTARAEGFIRGSPDIDEVIRRLKAFADAGADCLYAPGLREEAQIRAVAQAVAPKPINVLSPGQSVAALAGMGVRRISLGGGLAAVAWGAVMTAIDEINERGTFTALATGARLNPLFAGARRA